MENNDFENAIRKDFKFKFVQFRRRNSFWIYPLIVGILYFAFILIFSKRINTEFIEFLETYKPSFIDGLFTIIGFDLTAFTIICTINKKFYRNHLKPLCLNILFSIIFGLIGIFSSFFSYGQIIIIGLTLMSLTNFIIIVLYIYVTAIKYKD